MHVCEMSLSLTVSFWFSSVPSPSRLQPLSLPAVPLSLSGWLCLSWSPSLSLPPSLLPPPSPLSLRTGRGLQKNCDFPPARLPNPFPSPGFFSAPYSRQIKCTQLLPAETGLNCTPVAMAIPDDLRGWNVALRSPCWRLWAPQPCWPRSCPHVAPWQGSEVAPSTFPLPHLGLGHS